MDEEIATTIPAETEGSLKKEIIFTGDVLNTSARIQGLGNHFDADLLVSEDLAEILQLQLRAHTR